MSDDMNALADDLRSLADYDPDSSETVPVFLRRAAAILDHLAAAPGPLRMFARFVGRYFHGKWIDRWTAWLDGLADLTEGDTDE